MWPWLVTLGQWLIRLIGGWLPIGTKPVSEWLGKVLWCAGLIALGLFVYHKVTQPTTSTTQRADSIVNHYYQPKQTFGCAHFKVFLNEEK